MSLPMPLMLVQSRPPQCSPHRPSSTQNSPLWAPVLGLLTLTAHLEALPPLVHPLVPPLAPLLVP